MGGNPRPVVYNPKGISFVSFAFSVACQADVDVWKYAGGLGGVKAVFNKLPDGGEDSSSWVGETRDFAVAVKEVRGADLLKRF